MLFNSIDFVLFLSVVVGAYFLAPAGWRWIVLLVASYAFYMSWNPVYMTLIVGSTLIDFLVSNRLSREESPKRRKGFLLISLGANLGLLFAFKYWNFFNENARALFGASWVVPDLDLLLPVGISFYTFQTLGYTVDVYRREVEPEKGLGRFALYVTFFPQLVAGPIERASQLLPQLRRAPQLDGARLVSGLERALWGLFKKVVIADRLALYVDVVYGNLPAHGPLTYLLATYAFAFQIYCDFSGYSDIAIGCARIFGIDLMENFRAPYLAKTITEFWRRWHISLSTWLRDYLYIPLGGNRQGVRKTYRNLMTTMLLGGLWHGASWNFVIWGVLHGLFLSASRMTFEWRERLAKRLRIPGSMVGVLRTVVTFHLVCFAWVFFRASSLDDSRQILSGFVSGDWESVYWNKSVLQAFVGLLVLAFVQLYQYRVGSVHERVMKLPVWVRWAGAYGLIFSIILFGVEDGSQFIYFQF